MNRDAIISKFRDEMQVVYGKMLKECGVTSGDIELLQLVLLEDAEATLANVVCDWLQSRVREES